MSPFIECGEPVAKKYTKRRKFATPEKGDGAWLRWNALFYGTMIAVDYAAKVKMEKRLFYKLYGRENLGYWADTGCLNQLACVNVNDLPVSKAAVTTCGHHLWPVEWK